MPSFDYRSGPFLLNSSDDGDTDGEKIPSMSIGSGSLLDDMSMPRLQFRDWMGKPDANDNDVPERPTIMERADLDLLLPERDSNTPLGRGDDDDNNDAFVMTESMVTFVLGSAVLFCAAILIILLVATCVRIYRRRQSRREQRDLEAQKRIAATAIAQQLQLRHDGGNDASERKPHLYPVRSLDFSRQQLNEILSGMDGKRNPLDF